MSSAKAVVRRPNPVLRTEMTGSNVIPIRARKPRASDIIEQAILSGRRLPLAVMLERMWDLEDEILRLESSNNFDDQLVARVSRDRLFRVAESIAPYVHPKQAATVISGDPDSPIHHTHEARRRFETLTTESAQRFLDALADGTMSIEQVNDAISD
jgi:hypothetical protein